MARRPPLSNELTTLRELIITLLALTSGASMTQQFPPPSSPYGQQPPPCWAPPSTVPDPRQWEQMSPHAYPASPPPAPPRKNRRWPWAVVAVVLLLIVLVAAAGGGESAPASPAGGSESPGPLLVAPAKLEPAKAITARDWQLIAKDPEAHSGNRIIVYGQVVQFDASTGAAGFRANVDGVEHKPKYGHADYDTNTVLKGDEDVLKEVVQDDLFRAEVTVAGAQTYETVMGGKLTAPV